MRAWAVARSASCLPSPMDVVFEEGGFEDGVAGAVAYAFGGVEAGLEGWVGGELGGAGPIGERANRQWQVRDSRGPDSRRNPCVLVVPLRVSVPVAVDVGEVAKADAPLPRLDCSGVAKCCGHDRALTMLCGVAADGRAQTRGVYGESALAILVALVAACCARLQRQR